VYFWLVLCMSVDSLSSGEPRPFANGAGQGRPIRIGTRSPSVHHRRAGQAEQTGQTGVGFAPERGPERRTSWSWCPAPRGSPPITARTAPAPGDGTACRYVMVLQAPSPRRAAGAPSGGERASAAAATRKRRSAMAAPSTAGRPAGPSSSARPQRTEWPRCRPGRTIVGQSARYNRHRVVGSLADGNAVVGVDCDTSAYDWPNAASKSLMTACGPARLAVVASY